VLGLASMQRICGCLCSMKWRRCATTRSGLVQPREHKHLRAEGGLMACFMVTVLWSHVICALCCRPVARAPESPVHVESVEHGQVYAVHGF